MTTKCQVIDAVKAATADSMFEPHAVLVERVSRAVACFTDVSARFEFDYAPEQNFTMFTVFFRVGDDPKEHALECQVSRA